MDPPEDWRAVVAHAESRLKNARIINIDELISLGIAGAQIRQGVRLVHFTSSKILGLTQALARKAVQPPEWESGWLTSLLTARLDGERHVRDWTRVIPPDAGRPRAFGPPNDYLAARAATLMSSAEAFGWLLDKLAPSLPTTPRPYPHHDLRNLAWPRNAPEPTRATAADWGAAVTHLNRVWSQLVVALVLQPKRQVGTTEPNGLTTARTTRLDELERSARRYAADAAARQRTREGVVLSEVQRITEAVGPEGGNTVTRRIWLLEQLYGVSMWCHEAGLAKGVLKGR